MRGWTGRWIAPLGALVALTSGCGGPGQAAGPTTPAGGEAEAAAPKPSAIEVLGITPPEQPWAEMAEADREFYMIGKVLPVTAEVFRGFDAHAFAEFGCESCHGADGEKRQFAMPTPELPPVPPYGSPAFAEMQRNQPRMVHFMTERVTPVTRTLLGFAEFDPSTGKGFGCNGCHPTP
jgi:hypothetical protein